MKKITKLVRSKITESLSITPDDLYSYHVNQITNALIKLKNLFHQSSVK
jgi:hypothetical protein